MSQHTLATPVFQTLLVPKPIPGLPYKSGTTDKYTEIYLHTHVLLGKEGGPPNSEFRQLSREVRYSRDKWYLFSLLSSLPCCPVIDFLGCPGCFAIGLLLVWSVNQI